MLPITLLARTFGAKVLNVDLSQYDAQTVKTSKHSSTNTKSWSSKTMPISHPKGFSASPKNLAPQREPRIQPGRTYLVILVLRIHTRRIIQRDQMGGQLAYRWTAAGANTLVVFPACYCCTALWCLLDGNASLKWRMSWTDASSASNGVSEREFQISFDGHNVPGVYWQQGIAAMAIDGPGHGALQCRFDLLARCLCQSLVARGRYLRPYSRIGVRHWISFESQESPRPTPHHCLIERRNSGCHFQPDGSVDEPLG